MAYKIRYGPKIKAPRRRGRLLLLTLAFFALFILCAYYLLPQQLADLREVFIPQQQVDELLQQLQEGASISDAVGAFCQEIFHGK